MENNERWILRLVVLLMLLLLCVFAQVLSLSAQTLTPRMYVSGADTSLCFSVEQSRELAKIITKRQFELRELATQGDVIRTQESQLTVKSQLITLQNEQLLYERGRVVARDSLIGRQQQALQLQSQVVEGLEKAVRREKRKTRFAGFVGVSALLALLFIL